MDIHVNVTQRDIEKGKPKEILCCPVALAVHRAIPNNLSYVGTCYMSVDGRIFDWPTKIIRFIQHFDSNLPVKPFKFILRFMETA